MQKEFQVKKPLDELVRYKKEIRLLKNSKLKEVLDTHKEYIEEHKNYKVLPHYQALLKEATNRSYRRNWFKKYRYDLKLHYDLLERLKISLKENE